MKTIKVSIFILSAVLLMSCGESAPAGPDLNGIETRDHAYFNEIFNRCNVGSTGAQDCNCVARVNVKHRAAAYEAYATDYDTVHKPEMETEIEQRRATLIEKTRNRSDERVLEALEEELHALEAKLAAGIDNIDDFKLPFLPAGATDECALGS